MFKVSYLVTHTLPDGRRMAHHGEELATFAYLADANEYVESRIANAIDFAYRIHGMRVELVDRTSHAVETTYGDNAVIVRTEYAITE